MRGFRAESTPMTATLPDHQNQPNSLGRLLSEHHRDNPGAPLLFLARGLTITAAFETAVRDLLDRIEKDAGGPVVLTALSNAVNDLNPFSGLGGGEGPEPSTALLESMVCLLGPGEILEWNEWPGHFALFSAGAVEALAGSDIDPARVLTQLKRSGGALLLADSIFLHDPSSSLFHEQSLQPHERRRPSGWGLLRQRLDDWLRLPDPDQPAWTEAISDFRQAVKPITLHVTHSWGGGVAKWVESFIDGDESGVNLQLRSEGPQSGKGYGQRLSLYLDNQLDAPIASWWLQPAIQSTSGEHPQYRSILGEITSRYGVGRLVASSLVGHSLDALATGLPTIQVLHDFYPLWPLLGIHPGPYLETDSRHRLQEALREHALLPGFRHRNAGDWHSLGKQWHELVQSRGVRVAAPSRSVAGLLRQLDPAWEGTDIEIIPHGLPELPGSAGVVPRDREDGRLRLVIPGRIQEGKGQKLLLEALPELSKIAQVYLLGAGKDGEVFFGISGVDIVLQYRREELRSLLATIGPHAACLLSVVPETFSYTLSEMQQLNIPVIATRVGSLEERITDGDNGWLIEPDATSLLDRIKKLASNRADLSEMRIRLEAFDLPGIRQMVEEYEKLCRPRPSPRSFARLQTVEAAQASALAFQTTELMRRTRALEQQNRDLQTEVEKRSAWAEDREKARKDEVERRIRWVNQLEESLEHEQGAHRETNLRLEKLRSVHDWVLDTASWRYTRIFRVLGRISANLRQARAWNPLRWPLLLSQAIRALGTQGLKGALLRSQSTHTVLQKPAGINSSVIEAIGDPTPPGEFQDIRDPEISIVIPVYNNWEYTAACLRSLAETPGEAGFEVIVVDDGSSDETPVRLAGIKGLVNIRNKRNLGFVGSCNRGAEAARGRYVVMLNNDTQVLDGWLDALAETFRLFPDTGLAGGVLVYPDGTMQEAGGIVFRDGSGWNYGKGDEAGRPSYQYTREVDYCSGACIMLETRLFRELGGFDEHYAPAYYEDTDLAFRVREKGLKVRVQPRSVIIHHEGATSGTDLNEGAKRYQAVNREKFLERWKVELATFPGPIADPSDSSEIRRARDHRLKGRLLLIDAYTPEPDQDSGSVRLCYLMDCLIRLGYGVTFLADNRSHAGSYTTALQQAGVEVVYEPWIESLQRFFSDRGPEFDFVMISRHYVASNYVSLLRRFCPGAKFIFDTVDLHYLREERMADLEDSHALRTSAAQTRRSELKVIDAADATIVVSPVEKEVLSKAAPDARVHVISNVHEVAGSQRQFADRKDIFFVGGYQHPPNIDAALWFARSIWPLVHKELPEMEFHLIGSKAPEQVRALDGGGIRFHGFVKSLEPWLDGCRLAVAPLRYGAGIKGKVNMSMSRGQPVVATPMAVEGMFAKSGRDVLVADTAEEFAAEIVRLYSDEALWNQISAAGLENVRQYFSVETASRGLQELLNTLSQD